MAPKLTAMCMILALSWCVAPAQSQPPEPSLRIKRKKTAKPAEVRPADLQQSMPEDPTSALAEQMAVSPKAPVTPAPAAQQRQHADSYVGKPADSEAAEIAQLEKAMWERVNKDRAAHGSPPLRLDPQLSNVARAYAQQMMKEGFFAHVDPNGKDPNQRARAHGITRGVYENISWASRPQFRDIDRLNESQDDMMAEPPNEDNHRSNILKDTHLAVGIGIARNRNRIYMVQEFLDPNPQW
jgi:uncharacterized protein YkwD